MSTLPLILFMNERLQTNGHKLALIATYGFLFAFVYLSG